MASCELSQLNEQSQQDRLDSGFCPSPVSHFIGRYNLLKRGVHTHSAAILLVFAVDLQPFRLLPASHFGDGVHRHTPFLQVSPLQRLRFVVPVVVNLLEDALVLG